MKAASFGARRRGMCDLTAELETPVPIPVAVARAGIEKLEIGRERVDHLGACYEPPIEVGTSASSLGAGSRGSASATRSSAL